MPNDTTAHEFAPELPNYRETFLYSRSIDLAVECYKLVQRLPEEERFNLVDDIMQTTVKICANIAGAYEEESPSRRLHYFDVARGKVKRLQSHLAIAVEVEYVDCAATTRARVLANEMDGWLKTIIKQLASP
jgi:four helix bundle protein